MESLAIGLSVTTFAYAIILYLIYGEWKTKVRLFVVRIKSVMIIIPVFREKLLKSLRATAFYRIKFAKKLVGVSGVRGRG